MHAPLPSSASTRLASARPPSPSHVALDEAQLALRWNLSIKTLRRWRRSQLGPMFCKLGQRVTYLVHDIEAFERRVARHTRSIRAGERHDD